MRPAATLPVYRVPGTDYVLVDYGGVKGCRWRWELPFELWPDTWGGG